MYGWYEKYALRKQKIISFVIGRLYVYMEQDPGFNKLIKIFTY